eukprot:scaffold17597_cov61-Phaeocystis_antarctica.AAC.4
MGAWSGGAEAQGQARVQVQARAAGNDSVQCERGSHVVVKASRRPWFVESLGSRFLWSMRGWGRTERVEPWVGGLGWHAMRVGRLLRSSEGVGAESHRVTGSQGRRATFEESRGCESIAAHIAAHIAHASRLGGGGVALTGRHA